MAFSLKQQKVSEDQSIKSIQTYFIQTSDSDKQSRDEGRHFENSQSDDDAKVEQILDPWTIKAEDILMDHTFKLLDDGNY
jgi:hypothetical protein